MTVPRVVNINSPVWRIPSSNVVEAEWNTEDDKSKSWYAFQHITKAMRSLPKFANVQIDFFAVPFLHGGVEISGSAQASGCWSSLPFHMSAGPRGCEFQPPSCKCLEMLDPISMKLHWSLTPSSHPSALTLFFHCSKPFIRLTVCHHWA
jgi:hypothetical protein